MDPSPLATHRRHSKWFLTLAPPTCGFLRKNATSLTLHVVSIYIHIVCIHINTDIAFIIYI